jgi:nitrate reductase gamma subunit
MHHVGDIVRLLAGHVVGLLTPHFVYEIFITAHQ